MTQIKSITCVVTLVAIFSIGQAAQEVTYVQATLGLSSARSDTTSNVFKNMHRLQQIFHSEPLFALKFPSRFNRHELILRVLSGIDRMILKGQQVQWEKFPPAPPLGTCGLTCRFGFTIEIPMTYKRWFDLLKTSMNYLFYSDSCALFWNEAEHAWFTCCEATINGEAVEYCGSNVAMGIPDPCRKPSREFDYGLLGSLANYSASGGTSGNHGNWACQASQQSATNISNATRRVDLSRTSRPLKASSQRTGRRKASIKTASADYFISLQDYSKSNVESPTAETFEIDVAPEVQTGGNLCGTRATEFQIVPACFMLCCDSIYASSTLCSDQRACF